MKRTQIRRKGKKGNEWDRARAELKSRFQRAGITTCEARLEGCWRDNTLGFMHRFKRRNIATPEELRTCALGCQSCHEQFEILPEAEMAKRIDQIIRRRPEQP